MKEKIQKVLNDSCSKDSGYVPVKKDECYRNYPNLVRTEK